MNVEYTLKRTVRTSCEIIIIVHMVILHLYQTYNLCTNYVVPLFLIFLYWQKFIMEVIILCAEETRTHTVIFQAVTYRLFILAIKEEKIQELINMDISYGDLF